MRAGRLCLFFSYLLPLLRSSLKTFQACRATVGKKAQIPTTPICSRFKSDTANITCSHGTKRTPARRMITASNAITV